MHYLIAVVLLMVPVLGSAEEEAPRSELSATEVTRMGILMAALGDATTRLGYLLEEGNVEDVKATIKDLRAEVDEFGARFKEFTGPEYASSVDSMVASLHSRLEEIEAGVTEDNLEKAQEAYRNLQENWGRLGDYTDEKVAQVMENKEEVKSWLSSIVDSVYGYFYPEAEPEGAASE